ncbi:hypothetical protein ACQ5SO_03790 [Rhodovulum sp. DZ06]|uniref:hypothetical protein n=1 Tax=Rhodovulum sp. DZ06 TaxID=3425126 RepID=UPI003D34230C
MEGRIAIIGWGSLIWDLDDLAPHVEGAWRMGGGPALPLEFSRISPKRLMGLAVCIDEGWGAPCPTHAIRSARRDVAAAREDLARRERAPLGLIGQVCLRTGLAEGPGAGVVADWARAVGAAGAVWTGLRPNFAEHAGRAFDHDAAEAWVLGLEGASRDEAVRYLENAPAQTDTPLRRRLASRDWWRAEAARVAALDARTGA